MKHCGTLQLETERLILRRFRPEDAAAMFNNWTSDDEVTKYLTWPTHSSIEVSQYVTNNWVNSYSKDDYYQWAIVLKENGDENSEVLWVAVEGALTREDVPDLTKKLIQSALSAEPGLSHTEYSGSTKHAPCSLYSL